MTTIDILAWLGAITGTLALAWDIYKWRQDGVRLAVKAVTFGIGKPEGITFTICNRGGKPTTVSEVWFTYPPDLWFIKPFPFLHNAHRLFMQTKSKLKIPTLIQPGEMWSANFSFETDGTLTDSDNYPVLIAAGKLRFIIKCSCSNRCQRGRVKTPGLFG